MAANFPFIVYVNVRQTFFTASRKRLIIADLGTSGHWSVECSPLSAISIASSTGTLVYMLLTSVQALFVETFNCYEMLFILVGLCCNFFIRDFLSNVSLTTLEDHSAGY